MGILQRGKGDRLASGRSGRLGLAYLGWSELDPPGIMRRLGSLENYQLSEFSCCICKTIGYMLRYMGGKLRLSYFLITLNPNFS